MQQHTYAVVVYLEGPLAEFVNHLRFELNQEHADKAAHITVLPPRPLVISEEAAVEEARQRVSNWYPFDVEISGVSTFLPINGVVYLTVGSNADAMHVLHGTLNQGHLRGPEPWGYVPHITIAQDMDEARTQRTRQYVETALWYYRQQRRIWVERMTFVRQMPDGSWRDLA